MTWVGINIYCKLESATYELFSDADLNADTCAADLDYDTLTSCHRWLWYYQSSIRTSTYYSIHLQCKYSITSSTWPPGIYGTISKC